MAAEDVGGTNGVRRRAIPEIALIGGRAEVTGAEGTAPTRWARQNVRESAQLSGERFKVTPTRAGQQGRWMSTGIAMGWMSGALLPMASGPEA